MGEQGRIFSEIRNVSITGNTAKYNPDNVDDMTMTVGIGSGTYHYYEADNTETEDDTGPWVSTIFFHQRNDDGDLVRASRGSNVFDEMTIFFNDEVGFATNYDYTNAVKIYDHQTQEYLDLSDKGCTFTVNPADLDSSSDIDYYTVNPLEYLDASKGTVWQFKWDSPWVGGFYTVEVVGAAVEATSDDQTLDGDVNWAPGGNFTQEVLVALPGDATVDGSVNQADVDLVNIERKARKGAGFVDDATRDNVAEFDAYPYYTTLRMGPSYTIDTTGVSSLAFWADWLNDDPVSGTDYEYLFRRVDDDGNGWWLEGDIFTLSDGTNEATLDVGPISSWTHVGIVVDSVVTSGDRTIKLYLDGDLEDTEVIPTALDMSVAGAPSQRPHLGGSGIVNRVSRRATGLPPNRSMRYPHGLLNTRASRTLIGPAAPSSAIRLIIPRLIVVMPSGSCTSTFSNTLNM